MSNSVPAGVVARRMSDLLQRFPAAAMGGVEWETLARKYEDQYAVALDITSLGYESALVAASTLLFDVVRIVDSSDPSNPVVAVEDGIAMTASPAAVASWPSLYQALCEIAQEHGSLDKAEAEQTHVILVSQLKPLLQRCWHNNFDECSLGYITEEGNQVKLKKMKHLLQALLRWRAQRASWTAEATVQSSIDEALQKRLELVPAKSHNDLVLRCVLPSQTVSSIVQQPAESSSSKQHRRSSNDSNTTADDDILSMRSLATNRTRWSDVEDDFENAWPAGFARTASASDADEIASTITRSSMTSELEQELATLRAENARLRCKNAALEERQPFPDMPDDLFDNPFEPPPEMHSKYWGTFASPMAATLSDFSSFSSSCGSMASSVVASGATTPMGIAPGGTACAFVPTWFAMGERGNIPAGMVQQAKAIFERNASIPNFFLRQ